MSTRFDAAGDRISFAGTMFAVGSGFTMTAWAYVVVDTDANQTFARLHASSGATTIVTWATGSDGLSGPNYFTGGGTVTNATNMAVGAWRKIAITCTGTTAHSYVNTVGGTTEDDSGTVSVGTPDGLTLGGRSPGDSSEWFNGRLAYVRVWTSVLTQTQIEAEWASTTPVVTSGLWANWPLTDSTDLTDHSGNGRNLSAGSTAVSTEADPPLSGTVTGAGAAPLGSLTAAGTGVPTVTATGAGGLGALAGTASGVPKVLAAGAAPLGALTGAGSGAPVLSGTGTAPLGTLTATGAGTPAVPGTGSAALGTLAATATGAVTVPAAGAAAVGSLTAAGTGLRTVIATATATLGALTGHGSVSTDITGTGTASLGVLAGAGSGHVPAAPGPGSFHQLLAIYADAADRRRQEREQDPQACFECGEPLRRGPAGELYCRFDGTVWEADNRLVGRIGDGRA